MKCKVCGSEINNGDRFCNKCGTKLIYSIPKNSIRKKPFYKKIWFWCTCIAFLLILGVIGSGASNTGEIKGNILYIYKTGSYSTRDMYRKYTIRELEDIKSNIPSGVDTVCVWWKCNFTDADGNTSEDTVYRINLSVDDIKRINWDIAYTLNIEEFNSAEVYAWDGLE